MGVLDWKGLVKQVLTSILEVRPGLLQTSLAALRVPKSKDREHALMMLAMMGDPSGVGLEPLIKSERDRRALLHALARLAAGSRRSAARALAASDVSKRRAVAIELAMEPHQKGMQQLEPLLSDSDSVVRALARSSLVALGETLGEPNRAAQTLVSAVLEPDSIHGTEAACALPTVGPLGLDCLKELLAEHERRPRCAAAAGLRYATQDQAVTLLTEHLADSDAFVRCTAAESLGLHPLTLRPDWQARVVEKLDRALHDPEHLSRYSMARALSLTGGDAPPPALIRCLADSDPRVRFATAEALGDTVKPHVVITPGKGWFRTLEGTGEPTESTAIITRELGVLARYDKTVSKIAQRSLAAILAHSSEWPTIKAAAASSVQAPPPKPPIEDGGRPPRYADVVPYEEEKAQFGRRLPDASLLQKGTWYRLEVAIRLVPIGIGAFSEEPPLGVRPVPQAAPIEILVVAQSDSFHIALRTGHITLPKTGDSTANAVFRVRADGSHLTQDGIAALELRFYYRFNLIEYMTVLAPVAGGTAKEHAPFTKRLELVRHSINREYRDLDHFTPRRLNVHVTRRDDAYELNFAVSGESEGPGFALTARTRITSQDLESQLVNLRTRLEHLVEGSYLQKVQGSRVEFREAMQSLAQFGHALWMLLFRGRLKSELAHMGKALRESPLADGSLVQVSIDETAGRFFFPWALLFDGKFPESHETPKPSDFWGYRYGIEQQLGVAQSAPDLPRALTRPLRIDFMLWEYFPNASEQIALMQELGQTAAGKLTVSAPPIKDSATFYKRYKPPDEFDADVLYFYTHGHTRPLLNSTVHPQALAAPSPPADATEDDIERLREYRERRQRSLEESTLSWIGLSHGRLYYQHLQENLDDLVTQPLVFLNMCESAQVTPLSSESFVDFFLTRNARTVVGTECAMTIHFAHPFSRHFLTEVLKGRRMADALLSARRYFLDRQNPLGLAYTLFGSGTLSFTPPCVAVDTNQT
jgi:HEAT repeat protein